MDQATVNPPRWAEVDEVVKTSCRYPVCEVYVPWTIGYGISTLLPYVATGRPISVRELQSASVH